MKKETTFQKLLVELEKSIKEKNKKKILGVYTAIENEDVEKESEIIKAEYDALVERANNILYS